MGRYAGRSLVTALLLLTLASACVLMGALGTPQAQADDLNLFAPRVEGTMPVGRPDRVSPSHFMEVSVWFDSEMKAGSINQDTFYMDYLAGVRRVGDQLIPVFARVQAECLPVAGGHACHPTCPARISSRVRRTSCT